MAAAILVITLGGIMTYSALKGVSIVDAFRGATGDTLNPHGASGDTGSVTVGTSPNAPGLPSAGTNTYGFKGPNATFLAYAAQTAVQQFHLTITSTSGGVHVPDSYHYQHRAFDASGPASDMAAFYRYMHDNYKGSLLELFYDPMGAVKNGVDIPAIGGHTDHVHVAA